MSDIPAKPVAVIDIGATAIRMAIAEISGDGQVRPLDSLTRGVTLGKDTFSNGAIGKATIEQCVTVIQSYRQALLDYGIEKPEQIRIVATSAVREASNRLAFLDRIYIATGLEVDVIDSAEVGRLTYAAIRSHISRPPLDSISRLLIAEVSGGNSEMLLLDEGDIVFSDSSRLGSLRLRKSLETYRAPASKLRKVMENQIQRSIQQLMHRIPRSEQPLNLVALGGDVRFAVSQIDPEWTRDVPISIDVVELEKIVDELLQQSPDWICQRYHMSYPEAETVGPALLTYLRLAKSIGQSSIFVAETNLRSGLLREMATGDSWTSEFRIQIIRSAIELGRKYQFHESHARHVANLSTQLFQQLRELHGLSPMYEVLLHIAALLHEIGLFVSQRSHHKHAMYLISNSELFGLGASNQLLVALIARYHRRASPQPRHDGFGGLNRERRVAVSKLAAILRLAIALNESRSQLIDQVTCELGAATLELHVASQQDLSLEQVALRRDGGLFEETFGRNIRLR